MGTPKRFGDYAVELGYCTRGDVLHAIQTQNDLVERGFPKMLLGLVMVRYGIITNHQLIRILRLLEKKKVDCLLAD